MGCNSYLKGQIMIALVFVIILLGYTESCNINLQQCPCIKDGIGYFEGDLVPHPCKTCECMKGGVECMQTPCDEDVFCANPVMDNCCPTCRCQVDGYIYPLGDRVFSNNPCTDCRCVFDPRDGKVKVNCTVQHIGPIQSVDKCRPCTCKKNGELSCLDEPSCPKLPCDERYQRTPNNECCPQCGCIDKGTWYRKGGKMPSPENDICVKQCVCGDNLKRVCEKEVCPKLTCTNHVYIDGQCCPMCGCLDENDVFYEIGDKMRFPDDSECLEKCYCGENGKTVCDRVPCPATNCSNPITENGSCCSVCGCLDKEDKIQPIGRIDNPCQECECLQNSSLVCGNRKTCPNLNCVTGVYKPEAGEPKECCQQCRCKMGGAYYKPGEIFQGPKCTTCMCHASTGRVSCEKKDCSHVKLQCGNPIIGPDCCPVCPNGPACMYKKAVIALGEYKVFGKSVCTCLGDPWFPNAFCSLREVPASMKNQYNDVWGRYGYPLPKKTAKKEKKSKN